VYIGSYLPTFRDNLSVPSTRVKQSNKKAGNTEVRSYTENGMDGDRFSGNVMLANRLWGAQMR
jgi:hypothetical protein